ncbi:CPCC family cysteine-rich protein [Peribacillus frigoritolerans]|uniref:CPCC family cysteine-rich protein n=1 Tax=Peribacillus frigoritolerans TaxID=450367 RepID=UPI003D6D9C5A
MDIKTLAEEPPGTHDICRTCFWEDDNYQYEYPDEDGANKISFRKSQQNFIKFGVSDLDFWKS